MGATAGARRHGEGRACMRFINGSLEHCPASDSVSVNYRTEIAVSINWTSISGVPLQSDPYSFGLYA